MTKRLWLLFFILVFASAVDGYAGFRTGQPDSGPRSGVEPGRIVV